MFFHRSRNVQASHKRGSSMELWREGREECLCRTDLEKLHAAFDFEAGGKDSFQIKSSLQLSSLEGCIYEWF